MDRCRGPAPERGERPLPGDPIRGELPRALEAAERALGPRVEVAIDGHELAASSEQELQDGNVPAKAPAPQCPAPEERAAERSQRASRRRPGTAVGMKAGAPLERRNAARCRSAGNPVDRAPVEPVGAEGDLKARDLGIDAGGRGRRGEGETDENEQADDASHDPDPFRRGRLTPPVTVSRMLWAISGGAGFLGLHLSRRLLGAGHDVRSLDVAPLDEPELERSVHELRGDIRDEARVRELVAGADVVVHAAAALPIQASRESIRSVNVTGTENVLRAARDAGVRRVVFISSTAVYGVPEKHPIEEDDPLVGVGWYGESKIDAEALCRVAAVETTIVRPKTFIGPERLGVFEILFDWIREGRRIYVLGRGNNRYQLLAVEDLVDAIVRAAESPAAGRETFNVGATEFGSVRDDLGALIAHAGSSSRLQPVPVKPAEVALRALELLHVSPLAEWHYKTAHRDSFVDVSKAQRMLGWQPRLSNEAALTETYDWYLANRGRVGGAGVTHRVPWNQQALGLLKRIS